MPFIPSSPTTTTTMLLLLLLLLSFNSSPSSAAHCTTVTTTRTYQKCIALPSQGASVAWTYHPRNATLDIAFSGMFISPSGWVAWGVNPVSAQMTGTRALVAFSDPTSGGLLLLPYVLDPSVKLQNSPLVSRPLDLALLSSTAVLRPGRDRSVQAGAAVEIHATIKLVPNRTRINHVWNRGLYVQGYSPTIHPLTAADLASRVTIDVVSTAASMSDSEPPNLIRTTHALLNAAAWGFLIPFGVAMARYLRHYDFAGPAWFYTHAAVQMSGYAMGATGFALGIVMGNASPGVTYGLHRGLGVAAVVAGGTQAMAVLLRPGATHRYRRYWKSYHHFVGYGCAVVGVVNVFQGMEVMGLGGSYGELAYCLVLAAMMGGCVALEVNAWVVFCRKAKEERIRREQGQQQMMHVRKGSGSF